MRINQTISQAAKTEASLKVNVQSDKQIETTTHRNTPWTSCQSVFADLSVDSDSEIQRFSDPVLTFDMRPLPQQMKHRLLRLLPLWVACKS